jgi:hypothetical protein
MKGLNVSDFFFLGALLVVVLHRRSSEPSAPLPDALLVGLGLLIMGGIIGGLFEPAIDPFRFAGLPPQKQLFFFAPRVGEVIRFTWGTVGVLLIVRACRLGRTQIEHGLVAYGLGEVASVFWTVVHSAGASGRARGLASHPVFFGWISAFAVIVGIGLVTSGRRSSRRLGILIVAASVTGMTLSGTRSSVFILVLGLVFLQFGLRSAHRSAIFALVVVLAISLGLLGVGGETRTRLIGDQSSEVSNHTRDVLREASVGLVRSHGITGVGFRYLFQPHNLVLGVLGAAGVLGLAGLLLVVVSLARTLATTSPLDTTTVAVMAGALGVYTSWVVNVGWDRWLWVPIALVLAGQRSSDRSRHSLAVGAASSPSSARS